jgi:predicted GNAT family N-acyltransferase
MVIFKEVATLEENNFYKRKRREVFVEKFETAIFAETDIDEYDDLETTKHFVAYNCNGSTELIGTLRIISADVLPIMRNLKNFKREDIKMAIKAREVSRLILPECYFPAQRALLRFLFDFSLKNCLDFLFCECLSEKYAAGLAGLSSAFKKLPPVKICDFNVMSDKYTHPIIINISKLEAEVEINKMLKKIFFG